MELKTLQTVNKVLPWVAAITGVAIAISIGITLLNKAKKAREAAQTQALVKRLQAQMQVQELAINTGSYTLRLK